MDFVVIFRVSFCEPGHWLARRILKNGIGVRPYLNSFMIVASVEKRVGPPQASPPVLSLLDVCRYVSEAWLYVRQSRFCAPRSRSLLEIEAGRYGLARSGCNGDI